jgi:late competence protein required for DNA uptake (superfamily II DNA/RNA helicase)
MSKTRSKNRDEITHFKGIIRKLEKQIRQLQKQLKYYTKKDHLYEDVRDQIQEVIAKEDEIVAKKEEQVDCDKCNNGHMTNLLELLGKWYGECNSCGYRKRIK